MHSEQDSARQSRRLLNIWLEPLGQDAALRERIFGNNRAFRAAFHQLHLAASFRQAQHRQGCSPKTTNVIISWSPGFIATSGGWNLFDMARRAGPRATEVLTSD